MKLPALVFQIGQLRKEFEASEEVGFLLLTKLLVDYIDHPDVVKAVDDAIVGGKP
jgi:hypothetical protein